MRLTKRLLREYYEMFVRPQDAAEQQALLEEGRARFRARAAAEGIDLKAKTQPVAEGRMSIYGSPQKIHGWGLSEPQEPSQKIEDERREFIRPESEISEDETDSQEN